MCIETDVIGRPYGGIGWAISKKIKYKSIQFVEMKNEDQLKVIRNCINNRNCDDRLNKQLHDLIKYKI